MRNRVIEALRKKVERFHDRIASQTAKVRSKVITARMEVVVPATHSPTGRKELVSMKSSWIRSFAYDSRNRMLYMTVHSGKTYKFVDVEPEVAQDCIYGRASCRTNDGAKMRWWIGKNPSLGAAYWQYLKEAA